MEIKDMFVLDCKKPLIFVKEYKGYVVFDPIGLEFYIMNETAAEIMYLLSEGLQYCQMLEYYADNYDVLEDELKEMLHDFFLTSPFLRLIYFELIKNGVAEHCGI